MTSKNLFFNLQKEDLKRRIWTIALATLVFFLSFPVACAVQISIYKDSVVINRDSILEMLLRFFSSRNEMAIIITIVGALTCGLSSFFYLHSKKKVDLYHSLPVKRELIFATSYINGLIIYLIPYVINIVMCFIIVQINDYMTLDIFITALNSMILNLIFYILIYTVVIIAVMLTGNFVVSCLGTGVFMAYGPMLSLMKSAYFSDFFTTYYGNGSGSELFFLSPVGSYISTIAKMNRLENQLPYITLVKVLLVTLLLVSLSIYLYKKRPSEATNKAMAFPISRPIIKFMLVIPVSLSGGILFKEITNRASNGWFIFGLIFALIISNGIIEIIYNFDIRSAFNYKKQLLGCAAITVAMACIFQFDLFGYDTYLPSKDKIQTMSIAIDDIDSNLQYVEVNGGNVIYQNNNDYQLKNMKLEDYDSTYELAKIGVFNVGKTIEGTNLQYYSVKYVLKGGREIYRTYKASLDETLDIVKDIYSNSEYKEAHYPINNLNIGVISQVSCHNMVGDIAFSLAEDEKRQLVEIYREELNSLTLDEISHSQSLASLEFRINNRGSLTYYVYPTFERTIDFLQQHGFDPTKKVDLAKIKEVQVINNNSRMYENEAEAIDKYGYKSYSNVEQKEIQEIFASIVDREYYWNNQSIIKVNSEIEVMVTIREDNYGNENTYSFYFYESMIPDFVKKDIGYTN